MDTKRIALAVMDAVPGGKADDASPSDFDPAALEKGVKVEMEHTDDPDLAREIAMDHLTEFKDYYDALDKMESELEDKRKASTGPSAVAKRVASRTA